MSKLAEWERNYNFNQWKWADERALEKKKRYDKMLELFYRDSQPGKRYELDSPADDHYYDDCCSCHINPPCGYCLSKEEE